MRPAARWWQYCAVLYNRSQTHAMGQDEDLERLMGHLGQYQTLHFSITIPVVVFDILNYCRIVSILYPWKSFAFTEI